MRRAAKKLRPAIERFARSGALTHIRSESVAKSQVTEKYQNYSKTRAPKSCGMLIQPAQDAEAKLLLSARSCVPSDGRGASAACPAAEGRRRMRRRWRPRDAHCACRGSRARPPVMTTRRAGRGREVDQG